MPKASAIHAITLAVSVMAGSGAYAGTAPVSDPEFDQLLSLDISDLTVTSVSKREQKLNDTAAAVYVITQEDLRRAGVVSLPEALRMVPGLEVARVSAHSWAISARGFNSTLANKLLVMIDGRSIYTPVFSGTYWDDQSVMIEDIDRIEVIRGPGASLWGANAVDGIINIITKSAAQTQGNFVSATGGSNGGLVEARHGGQLGEHSYYRAYGQYFNIGASENPSGNGNRDSWYRARSGFRMDGRTGSGDDYTFQGDAYGGRGDEEVQLSIPTSSALQLTIGDNESYGGNLLGRWNHWITQDSQLTLQAYIDHYSRLEVNADQHVTTEDVEAEHSIRLSDRDHFIWGGGVRLYEEDLIGTFSVSANHPHQDHGIANLFAQNEYALVPNTIFATLGSKFEYNDYTGFEIEPSGRLSWHITGSQMAWGAISRAVRTPSTIDEDVDIAFHVVPGSPPTVARIIGDPNQQSEVLIAYELGHRIQATPTLSFDTTVYYNDFSRLETIGLPGAPYTAADGTTVVPYQIDNLGSGHVYGAEEAANWNISDKWRLTGSYTYTKMDLTVKPNSFITLNATQALAPRNQFSLRSYYNVTDNVHWDNMLYHVGALSPPVKAYTRYDSRISWLAAPGLELSLIGRNLLEPRHVEFSAVPQAEIDRSVVAQARWRF